MGFLPYSPQFCTHSFTIARGPMDLVVFLIYGMENLPLWYYPDGAQKRGFHFHYKLPFLFLLLIYEN